MSGTKGVMMGVRVSSPGPVPTSIEGADMELVEGCKYPGAAVDGQSCLDTRVSSTRTTKKEAMQCNAMKICSVLV